MCVQGLILPLCQAGDCTLREAVIIPSALQRTSIPVLHSAAALLRLADMAYSGTTSFFIRVLLDKKYALPYRVVSSKPCDPPGAGWWGGGLTGALQSRVLQASAPLPCEARPDGASREAWIDGHGVTPRWAAASEL